MVERKSRVKRGAKKVDKVITWIIVWTAVASMVWLSRTDKWKKVTNNLKNKIVNWFKKWKSTFWKGLIFVINFFKKK